MISLPQVVSYFCRDALETIDTGIALGRTSPLGQQEWVEKLIE